MRVSVKKPMGPALTLSLSSFAPRTIWERHPNDVHVRASIVLLKTVTCLLLLARPARNYNITRVILFALPGRQRHSSERRNKNVR